MSRDGVIRLEAIQGCSTKVSYRSVAAFNKRQRSTNRPGRQRLYPYRCPHCGSIHGSATVPRRNGL